MEWTIRLEMKTGWGDVETVELARITRPVMAATMADVGLSLTGIWFKKSGWHHPSRRRQPGGACNPRFEPRRC